MAVPLLVWLEVTASALFLLSVGPPVGGSVMLLLDRMVGTSFYNPAHGGDPLLWQHLFWFFGPSGSVRDGTARYRDYFISNLRDRDSDQSVHDTCQISNILA